MLISDKKSLSEIIYAIGDYVKNFELQQKNIELKTPVDDKLYKLKEILVLYPMLTTYSVNKAVNDKKLNAIVIGKTRYYKRKDIEDFICLNKINSYKTRDF